MAINITSSQLQHPNFVQTIKVTLAELELDPKYLELELTENVLFNNMEAVQGLLELRQMGVSIALDDFGTGYSNLQYLKTVPLNRLKIDQSFIKNINIEEGDEVIIRAIIAMAKSLNLEIIAEGVETKAQLDFLRLNQCAEVQGYYYSKPLNNGEAEMLLRQHELIPEAVFE